MNRRGTFEAESYQSRIRQMNASRNRFLYAFVILFCGGYLFFFTSTLWLPSTYVGVDVTPIGTPISAGERTITIDAWTCSSEQKMMEILIEVENHSIDGIDRYQWQVRTKRKRLPVQAVAEDDRFIALHVSDVPADWTEAALTMQAPAKLRRMRPAFDPVVIYVNDHLVAAEDHISVKSLSEYKAAAYEMKISTCQDEIRRQKKEADECAAYIRKADMKIAEIQEDMRYQTSREIEESNSRIDELQAKKERLAEEKEEHETEIQELQKKIKLQKQLLQDLQNGSG